VWKRVSFVVVDREAIVHTRICETGYQNTNIKRYQIVTRNYAARFARCQARNGNLISVVILPRWSATVTREDPIGLIRRRWDPHPRMRSRMHPRTRPQMRRAPRERRTLRRQVAPNPNRSALSPPPPISPFPLPVPECRMTHEWVVSTRCRRYNAATARVPRNPRGGLCARASSRAKYICRASRIDPSLPPSLSLFLSLVRLLSLRVPGIRDRVRGLSCAATRRLVSQFPRHFLSLSLPAPLFLRFFFLLLSTRHGCSRIRGA